MTSTIQVLAEYKIQQQCTVVCVPSLSARDRRTGRIEREREREREREEGGEEKRGRAAKDKTPRWQAGPALSGRFVNHHAVIELPG